MGMPEGRRRVERPSLRWMDGVKRDAGRQKESGKAKP